MRKLFYFFLFFCQLGFAQNQSPQNTELEEQIIVQTKLSKKDINKIERRGYVQYEDTKAVGDGKTNDLPAIVMAHFIANALKLPVKVKSDALYYLSGNNQTAEVMTSVDFGNATFIIDDRAVKDRNASIFLIKSNLKSSDLKGLKSLKKNQENIGMTLDKTSIITVTDSTVRRYIRYGLNQNNGQPQTDIFIVDKNGKVEEGSPIIWDFEQITEAQLLPIDTEVLEIKGGNFRTIANQEESRYTYFNRNIAIRRSNVLVDGLKHTVEGEGPTGAPYGGFLNIKDCAYVTVQNTILTGHKTYQTIGNAGKPVSMGSYDISIGRAIHVTFKNCTQTNDINDPTYWGIMGSNYCKNLVYENCVFSRFDAHMGVANARISNSTLGHMGINAIGTGTFLVENSHIKGRSFINLRSDYGSTWEGDFVIKDCIFTPGNGKATSASLIAGYNHGQHDFGYTCYMPYTIRFENLVVNDENLEEPVAIFADFNSDKKDETYVETYPYILTKEVAFKNLVTASGRKPVPSKNTFMFKDVVVRY